MNDQNTEVQPTEEEMEKELSEILGGGEEPGDGGAGEESDKDETPVSENDDDCDDDVAPCGSSPAPCGG